VLLAYSAATVRLRAASPMAPAPRPSASNSASPTRWPTLPRLRALLMAGLDGIKNKIHPGGHGQEPRPAAGRTPRCRPSAVRCAKRSTRWLTTTSCSKACSPGPDRSLHRTEVARSAALGNDAVGRRIRHVLQRLILRPGRKSPRSARRFQERPDPRSGRFCTAQPFGNVCRGFSTASRHVLQRMNGWASTAKRAAQGFAIRINPYEYAHAQGLRSPHPAPRLGSLLLQPFRRHARCRRARPGCSASHMRANSDVQLSGNARDWWGHADGVYTRGNAPAPVRSSRSAPATRCRWVTLPLSAR
jgi:hypothetical protein